MTQSPPAPRPPADDADGGSKPPYLLAMPAGDGAPGAIAWPDGQPAWAIPVNLSPGTRGYAIFLPLVPVAETGSVATPDPAGAVPAGASGTPATTAASAGPAGTPATVEVAGGASPADVTSPTNGAGPANGTAGTTSPTNGTSPANAATSPANGTSPAAATSPAGTSPADATSPANGTDPAAVASTAARPGPPAPGAPLAPAGMPGRPGYPPYPGGFYRPTPPGPSFFQRHWPGPKPARGRAVPAAVLAGALGLAFFVPLGRTGIGWFLGWLVLTAGVVFAVRRSAAKLPRAERWVRGGWAVSALALLSVLTFRNAWWLVTFCVLGALGCATLAVVGGRRIRSILFSLVAGPIAAFRGLPWVRDHFRSDADPGLIRRVVGSVAATVAALLIFGSLLASADGAFNVVLGAVVPEVDGGAVFRWVFLAVVGALCAVAAVWTLAAPPDLSAVDKPAGRSLGMFEWAPAIAALTLLFGGFVAVQFTVLFGGQRHVLRTAGLNYAEYARSGFWQLAAVTVLTLAVLAAVGRWARRESRAERIALRLLLGTLSALSVVIVISALSRMYTYQKVYSFTGERIFVMAFELLLGTVFLMILVAGLRLRGGWIPGGTVALTVVMLLGLAILNPEGYAAGRNIDRYEQTGRIDAWYLRALSADATPALTGLPDPARRCTLSWIAEDLREPDPWYAWNLGRVRARQALERVGPAAVGGPKDCRTADKLDLPKTRQPR
ncbi:DUF4153 domain-containing protein [Micromonospora sp. NPDC126480]|uniref:DUF4153 domain-containing protein n=1 Tax=Micromonospora sp. NPDC126480 TaxID=3155312 RepID=UPI0033195FAF